MQRDFEKDKQHMRTDLHKHTHARPRTLTRTRARTDVHAYREQAS